MELPAHFVVYSTPQNMLEWNWNIAFTSSWPYTAKQNILQWSTVLQVTIFDTKFETFCLKKISLSGTPISLPKLADLLIWVQEKITYEIALQSSQDNIFWHFC